MLNEFILFMFSGKDVLKEKCALILEALVFIIDNTKEEKTGKGKGV